MKKPEQLGQKLLCLAGIALLLFLWRQLQLPCPVRSIIGIPCPGCGLTRACLAALHLDFSAAFAWHPMFWCVPALALFIVYDGKVFRSNKVNLLLWGSLLAGFIGV